MYHLRNEELITRDGSKPDNHSQGLKLMSLGLDSLIAYACAPGTVAYERTTGEKNSIFTKHLLKHIVTPNKDIRMILSAVTHGVIQDSSHMQIPHSCSVLQHENIYLYEQLSGK